MTVNLKTAAVGFLFLAVVGALFMTAAHALDTPIIRAHAPYAVNCPSVDGGAYSDTDVPFDGGTPGYDVTMETFGIANDSTTCVRFAPASPTDRGYRVGSGCRDGSIIQADSMIGSCRSEGVAVKVDIIPGQVR